LISVYGFVTRPIYTKQSTTTNLNSTMEGTYKYQSDELSTFRNRESKESAGIGNIVIHVCDETKNGKHPVFLL